MVYWLYICVSDGGDGGSFKLWRRILLLLYTGGYIKREIKLTKNKYLTIIGKYDRVTLR